jgi:hypothetical protein
MENNKDTLDLKPYYKLARRFFSNISLWFNKNTLLIFIVFTLIVGYKIAETLLSEDQYSYYGVVDKEFISNDNLVIVLKSLSKNIEVLGSYENAKKELNENELLFELNRIEYNVLLNIRDNIVQNSNRKIDSIQIDFNVPLEVSLFSNYIIDSIGKQFTNYLNEHPFILKLRKERLFELNKQKNELLARIDFVDLMIIETQTEKQISKSNEIYFNNEKYHEVFDLVTYKDELIEKLTEIEIYLEKAKNREVFIIDGFDKAEKVVNIDFYSLYFYVKYFIYSSLFVLIFSYPLNKIFKRN